MTISTTTSSITYTGNGSSTGPYSVPFYFAAASELTVTLRTADTITAQSLTTHYTVSGAGSDSGSITFVTAPTNGYEIRIERNTARTQTLNLTAGSAFEPEDIEGALDKLTRIAQDLARGSGGGSGSGTYDNIPLTRTASGAEWDAGGLVVQNAADGVDATDLATVGQVEDITAADAAAAAASAAAALASQSAAATSATTASTAATTATTQATNASTSATNAATSETNAATSAAAAALSAAGAANPAFQYKWSTNTAASDPGSTYLKGNNASLASITTLYVSETSVDGAIGGALAAMLGSTSSTKAYAIIIEPLTRTNYLIVSITADTDSGTYRTWTATVLASNGSFAADDTLALLLAPVGLKGDSGAGTGDLLAANNLSELTASAATARGNISAAKSGVNTDITSVTLDQTGLKLKGADADALTIRVNENLSAARTLSLVTGDADRTITLAGSPTLSGTNTGDQTITLTGDVTGSGTGSFAATIANDAVTYAKLQNVSATQRVLARNTAGAGDVEEAAISTILDWIGSTRGQILYRGAAGWAALSPGTSGYVLTSNGAGADPSYQTGGTARPTLQVFTASGTWTKPANCKGIKVTGTGGGGGGGGSSASVRNGGSAGGTFIKYLDVSALSSGTVTIGAGGASSSNGGDTTFVINAVTYTGAGGSAGSTGKGPSGGSATNGDVNVSGGDGGMAPSSSISGVGGTSFWGGGGSGSATASDVAPNAGQAYGAGGGGGGPDSIGNATAGGAGKAGVIIVEEYY